MFSCRIKRIRKHRWESRRDRAIMTIYQNCYSRGITFGSWKQFISIFAVTNRMKKPSATFSAQRAKNTNEEGRIKMPIRSAFVSFKMKLFLIWQYSRSHKNVDVYIFAWKKHEIVILHRVRLCRLLMPDCINIILILSEI